MTMTTLLFDLDGTLIDSAPSILSGFRAAFEEAGIGPVLPLTSAIIGPPLMQTLANLTGGADEATLSALAAGFKRHYDSEGYKETVVFPGVADMLASLAGLGLDLHIATNKRLLPTERILEFLGWRPWFNTVYAADMPGRGFKGKGAMVAAQMADLNLAREAACYIGDRQEDRQAAEENGLPFIAACWGYGGFADARPEGVALAAAAPAELVAWAKAKM
ncbi:MAG: HAD hydrolase-like protein [Rhodocyclaceae bacterium]|nr:HAD hydrolase-like protein [Rhodocyclaceae bacterium]